MGVLQPISDAAKLSNKQTSQLSNFSSFFFYRRALFILSSRLFLWSCSFSEPSPIRFKYPVLVLILVLAIARLNSITSGWGSFRKYPLLGSMRTVSQLISYESCLYMCLFFVVIITLGFGFGSLKTFSALGLLIPFCIAIWWPSFLAELNRTPYDFSEGERELVRGFNTEYGSNSFTLIFLAEYRSIVFFSLLTCIIFFSSSPLIFSFVVILLILWVRSVLPRYRFDKLIILAWKFFIPFLTCSFLCFCLFL